MIENTPKFLIVILKDDLKLLISNSLPSDYFNHENMKYIEQKHGDFTGFFDWLRDGEKQIVGIHYYPWLELNLPIEIFEKFSYVLLHQCIGTFRILFTKDAVIQEKFSDDQDFGSNRIYKSSNNFFAFSFGIDDVFKSFDSSVVKLFQKLECNNA